MGVMVALLFYTQVVGVRVPPGLLCLRPTGEAGECESPCSGFNSHQTPRVVSTWWYRGACKALALRQARFDP